MPIREIRGRSSGYFDPALRQEQRRGAVVAAASASAQFVAPTSYTATGAEGTTVGGSWEYFDDGGTQLTDGIFGIDAWSADLGQGNAQEWVGWYTTPATITFTFPVAVTVTAVTLGLARSEAAGIFIPPSITVGTETFALAPDTFPDGTRANLTFTLAQPILGTQLTVNVNSTPGQWAFLDEVQIAAAVPEPATGASLGLGLAALALLSLRRRGRYAWPATRSRRYAS